MPKIRLKKCSKGDHFEYVTHFWKKTKSSDGLDYSCRTCEGEYKNKWRLENPDLTKKHHSKSNQRRKANGYFLEYGRSEKKQQYDKEWAEKNKGKRQAINARSRNRPEAKKKQKEFNRKRRVRLKEIPDSMPTGWWDIMLDFYGAICAQCGSSEDLRHDHIIPITWDGSTHSLLNSQILCEKHNASKGNRHAIDYRDWTKGIITDDGTVIYSLSMVECKHETISIKK